MKKEEFYKLYKEHRQSRKQKLQNKYFLINTINNAHNRFVDNLH